MDRICNPEKRLTKSGSTFLSTFGKQVLAFSKSPKTTKKRNILTTTKHVTFLFEQDRKELPDPDKKNTGLLDPQHRQQGVKKITMVWYHLKRVKRLVWISCPRIVIKCCEEINLFNGERHKICQCWSFYQIASSGPIRGCGSGQFLAGSGSSKSEF